MSNPKTDGNQDDFNYIVKRLKEGFSYREAISEGFVVRPDAAWLKAIRPLAESVAAGKDITPVGLVNLPKKPVSYQVFEGKLCAIYPDGTYKEMRKLEEAAGATAISETQEPISNFVQVSETDQTKAGKKSRKKEKW